MGTIRTIIKVDAAGAGPATAGARRQFGGGMEFARLLLRAIDWLAHRAEISRQRRRLSELTSRELKDIGLTSADVWQECRKSFWRD